MNIEHFYGTSSLEINIGLQFTQQTHVREQLAQSRYLMVE